MFSWQAASSEAAASQNMNQLFQAVATLIFCISLRGGAGCSFANEGLAHVGCVTVSASGTSAPASPGFAPVGSLSLPSGVGFEYVLTTLTSPYTFCRLHMCGRAVLLLSCARRAALVVASCCFRTGLVVGIKAWIAQRALRHGSGDMGLTAGPQTWLLQRTHETWNLQKGSGKDPQTWAL